MVLDEFVQDPPDDEEKSMKRKHNSLIFSWFFGLYLLMLFAVIKYIGIEIQDPTIKGGCEDISQSIYMKYSTRVVIFKSLLNYFKQF